ncbi:MAG: transposase family protein, partial [Nannocystaceae bacterium]
MSRTCPEPETSTQPALGAESFAAYFANVPDPRSDQKAHPLVSILVLSLCAVICGADGPTAIEDFGRARTA